MIITLTPIPEMEYIYWVDQLISNQLAYSKQTVENIFSAGIYSAKIIKILQDEPILISSLGGVAGRGIKHYLDKSKIKSDIVWSEVETPHQIHICQQASTDVYALQHQEHTPVDKEMSLLNYKLYDHLKKVSTLVISSKNMSPSTLSFPLLLEQAHSNNVKTIFYMEDQLIPSEVYTYKPYTLLLRSDQLKDFSISESASIHEIALALLPLIGKGIHYIAVYLNSKGILLISRKQVCFVNSLLTPHTIHLPALMGAFLGALAIGISRKYEQEKVAKLCLAAILSVNTNEGIKLCTKKDIDYTYKRTHLIQVKPLY